MGDARYEAPYERLAGAPDVARELHEMKDHEVIHALAHASRKQDPLLANVLAVEASNRMHRSRVIARTIGNGIIGFDEAACINYMNPAAESAMGRGAAALRNQPWDALGVDARHDTRRTIARVIETGQTGPLIEDTWSPPNWARFDVEWQAYPILRDQRVNGAVVVFRDVSERVDQRAALARERETLHTILENVTEGIMLLDADGKYSFANTAALHILGIDREALFQSSPEQRPWRSYAADGRLMSPPEYPGTRSMREAQRVVAEFVVSRPDGTRATILLDAQPIFDPGDRLVGTVINFAKTREAPPDRASSRDLTAPR